MSIKHILLAAGLALGLGSAAAPVAAQPPGPPSGLAGRQFGPPGGPVVEERRHMGQRRGWRHNRRPMCRTVWRGHHRMRRCGRR